MSDAFVLLAHGSRDPAWVAPFDRIAARVREARPDAGDVALAYLEHAQPDLAGAVDGVVARGAYAWFRSSWAWAVTCARTCRRWSRRRGRGIRASRSP